MKKGFDELKVTDIIYYADNNTGDIFPCKVIDINIKTSEVKDIADRFDWTPKYVDVPCYKIEIKYEGEPVYGYGKILTVDLTYSNTYKFTFANFFVDLEDAKSYLLKFYNNFINYNLKKIKESQEEIRLLNLKKDKVNNYMNEEIKS